MLKEATPASTRRRRREGRGTGRGALPPEAPAAKVELLLPSPLLLLLLLLLRVLEALLAVLRRGSDRLDHKPRERAAGIAERRPAGLQNLWAFKGSYSGSAYRIVYALLLRV